MTGISNLNILVQQGSSAQEVHNLKQQSAEHTQMVAAQEQMASAAEANSQVQSAKESEKSYLKRDKSRGRNGGDFSGQQQKKKKNRAETSSKSTGKLLDTVA